MRVLVVLHTMKALILAGALGLCLVPAGALADCQQVRIDGITHQVCTNSPTVVAPVPYGGGAVQQGADDGAATYRLRMLLNALPPGVPPALPPGGTDVAVTGSKVHGTVRMVTDAGGLSGCGLLGAVRDDEFPDLAEKVLKLGGTHALLTGTRGKCVLAQAYRCQ